MKLENKKIHVKEDTSCSACGVILIECVYPLLDFSKEIFKTACMLKKSK